jgi:hypothetical protein
MNHTPETCPINERLHKIERQQRRLDRFGEVIFDSDMVGVRCVLAMAEFVWAVTLLWPGETFGRPTYHLMAMVGREEWWGFLFLLTAWTQWQIVMLGEFHSRFARVFAGWNAFLWVFVCTSMYFSVYPPPAAISGESALALAASWILIRPWIYKGGKRG